VAKHKDGKKHKKGSQFVIRVDKDERDAFVALCDRLDTTAAREVRRFMREWVAAHAASAEPAEPAPGDMAGQPDATPAPAAETVAAEGALPDADNAKGQEAAEAAPPRRKRKSAAQ
jgi:hypothetical protein